jgi:hypothetical protein
MRGSTAGGLYYHLRARRRAREQWRPFRDALDGWLAADFHPTDSLVLVGPSAGYCLTDAFFARFRSIRVLEPDPLARFMLWRRLRALGVPRVALDGADFLVRPLIESKRGLDELLFSEPRASVLFANVLGQVSVLVDDSEYATWHAAFRARMPSALRGRQWASFHDRLWSRVPPSIGSILRAPARLSDDGVRALYAPVSGTVELFEHPTEGLFPEEVPHAYLHWANGPGTHYLIEAVCGSASQKA